MRRLVVVMVGLVAWATLLGTSPPAAAWDGAGSAFASAHHVRRATVFVSSQSIPIRRVVVVRPARVLAPVFVAPVVVVPPATVIVPAARVVIASPISPHVPGHWERRWVNRGGFFALEWVWVPGHWVPGGHGVLLRNPCD